MSRFFFEKPLIGPVSDILPKDLIGKTKEKFTIVDRFSESIFREKGWPEKLQYEVVKANNISDLAGISQIIQAVSNSIDQINAFNIVSGVETQNFSEILTKSQEQFQGYFVENLQRRIGVEVPKTMKQQWQIQNPAANIIENLNPLNIFTTGSINSILNFITENSEQNSDIENFQDKVDGIFTSIWDVNNTLTPIINEFYTQLGIIERITLENNRTNIYALKTNFEKIQSIFNDTYWTSSENTLYEQCVEIKNILSSINDNYRKALIIDDNVGSIQNEITIFLNAKNQLSQIISNNSQILNSIECNYSDINPNDILRNEIKKVPFKINELFFIEDDQFEILYSKYYKNARNSYKISGHSSVNQNATTFVNKTKTRRDYITEVDESFPTNHEIAPKYIGSGDKLGEDENVDTTNTVNRIGPLQDNAYDDMLNCIRDNRSSSTIGELGHLGKYGFSAYRLIKHGFVKQGTSTKNLKFSENWLGKEGISNDEQFLADGDLQDKLIETELKLVYKNLLNAKVIKKSLPINQVGAAIAVGYKFNSEAVNNILKNIPFQSGNGDDARDLFNKISNQIDSTIPQNDITQNISNLGGSEPDQIEALASSNIISDMPTMYLPTSGSAHDYPHNHVKETESGHITEFDDTPGAERIQERHRTGTGYEIMPDGSRKLVVIGDGYKAIFGDDNIMVNGNCNISVFGDANISVQGDSSQSVSGDMNVNIGGNYNLNIEGDKVESISGSMISHTKGDKIENVEGFYTISTEGDMQIEGASLSLIARISDIDIMSPEFARIRAINTNIYGADSLSFASSKNITTFSDNFENITTGFKVQSETFGVDTNSAQILSNTPVKARVLQSLTASSLGGMSPLTGNLNIDQQAATDLDNFVNDPNLKENIENFEAFDSNSTQAYSDDMTSNITYYSTSNTV